MTFSSRLPLLPCPQVKFATKVKMLIFSFNPLTSCCAGWEWRGEGVASGEPAIEGGWGRGGGGSKLLKAWLILAVYLSLAASQVWHPNISSATGAICLDILKDQWSPALTLKTVMLSVQALLSSPEPGDPQDAVVAKQYLSDQARPLALPSPPPPASDEARDPHWAYPSALPPLPL